MVLINILGLNTLSYDIGSVLTTNNVVKQAIEEERLSRIKHHKGFLFGGDAPKLSIDKCVKGIANNFENVAFGWDVSYLQYLKHSYSDISNLILFTTNKRLSTNLSNFLSGILFGYKKYCDSKPEKKYQCFIRSM